MNDAFSKLVSEIPRIGVDWHKETILENSRRNAHHCLSSVREMTPPDRHDVLIVSAGPSLYRKDMIERVSEFTGIVVAIDGAYVQCLRKGLLPNFVLTLDPHPTRIVRWFGDPEFTKNSEGDDYFSRQDLDESFRENAERVNTENIALVDRYAPVSGLVICSTAPENVEKRTRNFDRYWFSPLVDNPHVPNSLTRQIAEVTGLPSLNTGGTVGTAAIMFAHCVLKARRIAVVGMDMGYHKDTPLERTQSWNMLKDRKDVESFYPKVNHPQWGECYTDATYFWYRQNLLSLLKAGGFGITNCSEGGALFGPRVECKTFEEWNG